MNANTSLPRSKQGCFENPQAGSLRYGFEIRGSRQRFRAVLFAMLAMLALTQSHSGAIEVWNGPLITFTNVSGSDPNEATNQDRITANVWITRAAASGQGGIYNAKVETGYTHSLSPVGTEWASGQLANYASLTYTNWEVWTGFRPPDTVGQDAVLHIIPDDVYLSVKFTSWGVGRDGVSGFSYVRSTPSAPEPSASVMMLTGLGALWGFQYHRRRAHLKRRA